MDNTTVTHPNVYERMLAVMASVTGVLKDKAAPQAIGGYRFASHDAVVGALRAAIVENGLVIVPSIHEHGQDGNRTWMLVEVRVVNAQCPEDSAAVYTLGFGVDSQDKGPGKAMSYATKMALLKMFCLPTGEDIEDFDAPHLTRQSPPEDSERAIKCLGYWEQHGVSNNEVFRYLRIATIEDITPQHVEHLVGIVQSIKDGRTSIDETFRSARTIADIDPAEFHPPTVDDVTADEPPAPRDDAPPERAEDVKELNRQITKLVMELGIDGDTFDGIAGKICEGTIDQWSVDDLRKLAEVLEKT